MKKGRSHVLSLGGGGPFYAYGISTPTRGKQASFSERRYARRNGAGSAAHFLRDIAAGWYTSGIAIATGDGEVDATARLVALYSMRRARAARANTEKLHFTALLKQHTRHAAVDGHVAATYRNSCLM